MAEKTKEEEVILAAVRQWLAAVEATGRIYQGVAALYDIVKANTVE